MANIANRRGDGGIENLIAYKQAVVLFDLTYLFCDKYLPEYNCKRTVEQMQQAARSGKQNIVEGSQNVSLQTYIKLSSFGRASFCELLEDFKDYARLNNIPIWDKNDPRSIEIRRANVTYKGENADYFNKWINNPEDFCNLMITLLHQEIFLLDRLINSLKEKFVNEGGFTENLRKERINKRFH